MTHDEFLFSMCRCFLSQLNKLIYWLYIVNFNVTGHKVLCPSPPLPDDDCYDEGKQKKIDLELNLVV